MSGARIALIVAASVATAVAKDVRTDFSVSATVLAVANLELQSAPMDLKISAADLRRGFIDVAQPTQVVVRSNSQSGFALEVLTVAPMLCIHGGPRVGHRARRLARTAAPYVQRWQKPQVVRLSLRF